jgi:hypothetical protein
MTPKKTRVAMAGLMLFALASTLKAEEQEQPTPVAKQAVGVQCQTTSFVRRPGQVD